MKLFTADNKLFGRLALVLITGASLFYLSCTQKRAELDLSSFEPEIEIAPDFSEINITSLPPSLASHLSVQEFEQEDWSSFFGVFVLDGENVTWNPNDFAINGSYQVEDDRITFTPNHPFLRETNYYIRFNYLDIPGIKASEPEAVREVSSTLSKEFTIANTPGPATFVEGIYPSTNSIPRNLLKFYVQLSASMIEGNLLNNVHIVNAEGDTLKHIFLEIPQELWDTENKRATIIFDPGRVKRGLDLREEFGAAFEVGKTYTLVINNNWLDGEQKKLRESYSKTFSVVEDDRSRPNPDNWTVIEPKEGTKQPVSLEFDEPFDYALLQRIISVRDENDLRIPGKATLGELEKSWTFTPFQAWSGKQYYIQIESILEDLAGNNLNTVFDVDLETATEVEVRSKPIPFVKIPFRAIIN